MELKTIKGNLVIIKDDHLKEGGQARIHFVLSKTKQPLVAKIYTDTYMPVNSQKAKDLQKRLEFMVSNNPFSNLPDYINKSFAWPEDLLFDNNGCFKGFLLPFIDASIVLSDLLVSRNLTGKWKKFNIDHPDSYNTRLKVCYNIAQALAAMHADGTYTLVDFKGDNLMLRDNGFVSIVDLDSIQITKNNRLLFPAPVHTPEYSPPECHNNVVRFQNDVIQQSWDIFSYAVLVYKILFNVHPFGGISHLKDSDHTVEDFIKKGYFAHGDQKNNLSCCPPHRNFDLLLNPELKDLFYRCFVEGHNDPVKRPSIKEWRDTILNEIEAKKGQSITAGLNQPKAFLKKKTIITPGKMTGNHLPHFVSLFDIIIKSHNAEIRWDVSNARECYLNGDLLPLKGLIKVPLFPSTFILEVVDLAGSVFSYSKLLSVETVSNFASVIPFDHNNVLHLKKANALPFNAKIGKVKNPIQSTSNLLSLNKGSSMNSITLKLKPLKHHLNNGRWKFMEN